MTRPRRTRPPSNATMPEISRIGAILAARRIQLGLTQQYVADLADVSRYSVQAVEHGTGSVKLASIVEIADILGLRLQVAAADGAVL